MTAATSRLEKTSAGQKLASGIFFKSCTFAHLETPLQVTETHQENVSYVYNFASGCAVGPDRRTELNERLYALLASEKQWKSELSEQSFWKRITSISPYGAQIDQARHDIVDFEWSKGTGASQLVAGSLMSVASMPLKMLVGNPEATVSAPARTPRSLLEELPIGKQPYVRTVKTSADLTKLYGELTTGGTPMAPGTYPGTVTKLPDGTIIRMRPMSKSGGATLDITYPDGTLGKVHIE